MGVATHSHRVAVQPLAEKLADNGHHVTIMSHISAERPHPKVKDYFPPTLRKDFEEVLDDYSESCVVGRLKDKFHDPFMSTSLAFDLSADFQKKYVENEEFRGWIQSNRFDLLIYDSPLKEIAVGIAHRMGAKIIVLVTTATSFMHEFEMFGLPAESSWLPDMSGGSSYPFIPNHFIFAYNALSWYFSFKWNYLPKLDEYLRILYDGAHLPPMEELLRKVDLVMMNEHFSSQFPKSLPPFVVQVGGMHGREASKELPKEIEEFISTRRRFVFISFGSTLKTSALPPEKREMLFDAVASLDDTSFLWKWEGEIPDNLPPNVYARKWYPQQDLLGHPKCKGFVTQGGAMSYQQAIYHAVPVIVAPIWGDQNYMAYSAEYQGIGIHLELSEFTKESFTRALREILDNEKYAQNIRETSRRFKDRPMSPVDTAAWWTEYVLQHDTAHLKSPGMQQYWWQRRLLDFWLTVLVVLLAAVTLSVTFLRIFVRLLISRKSTATSGGESNKIKRS